MRAVRIVKVVLVVLAACVVMSFVVMQLWNWLMPMIFGLRTITFFQALGLLLLSKLLLGGFHKHGGGRGGWKGRAWKQRVKERWEKMTPEERERFRAGMRARWDCRSNRDEARAEQGSR